MISSIKEGSSILSAKILYSLRIIHLFHRLTKRLRECPHHLMAMHNVLLEDRCINSTCYSIYCIPHDSSHLYLQFTLGGIKLEADFIH
jgi:hypothetical protein